MNLKLIIFLSILILIISSSLIVKYKPSWFNLEKTFTGIWTLEDTSECKENNSKTLNYGCYVDGKSVDISKCDPSKHPASEDKPCFYGDWDIKDLTVCDENNSQTVTYGCYRDGEPVAESKCDSSKRPSDGDKSCFYGTWNKDTTGCKENKETSTYNCYRNGERVAESKCDPSKRPPSEDKQCYSGIWDIKDTLPCGDDNLQRSTYGCYEGGKSVDNRYCYGSMPSPENKPCFYGSWDVKSAGQCISNSQELEYGCYKDGVLLEDKSCDPALLVGLNKNRSCGAGVWKNDETTCQGDTLCSDVGTKRFATYCVDKNNPTVILPDSSCDNTNSSKTSTEPCNVREDQKSNSCPKWVAGIWNPPANYPTNPPADYSTDCPITCNSTSFVRTRDVPCVPGTDTTLTCQQSSKPPNTDTCPVVVYGKSHYGFYTYKNSGSSMVFPLDRDQKNPLQIDINNGSVPSYIMITIPPYVDTKFILFNFWYSNGRVLLGDRSSYYLYENEIPTSTGVKFLDDDFGLMSDTYFSVNEITVVNKPSVTKLRCYPPQNLTAFTVDKWTGDLYFFMKRGWCIYKPIKTIVGRNPLGNVYREGIENLTLNLETTDSNNVIVVYPPSGSNNILFMIIFDGIQVRDVDSDLQLPTIDFERLTSVNMSVKSGSVIQIKGNINADANKQSIMVYMNILEFSSRQLNGRINVRSDGKYARQTYTRFYIYEY